MTVAPSPGAPTARRPRGRLHRVLHAHPVTAVLTKAAVSLAGGLVVLAGLVMLVTPGPAFLLIPLGLATLSAEWDWAGRLLHTVVEHAHRARERARGADPREHRRRSLLAGSVAVVVCAGCGVYVAAFGCPTPVVGGWAWAHSVAGWLPTPPV